MPDDTITQPTPILGRYRPIGAAGTGGFGQVLACWDTRLQRRVAIKRIPVAVAATAPAAAASTMAAALAEARTSSLLAHNNIVTVYDFEADNTSAYLVMEYVDGITLAELLSRVEGGTLTPDETCYVVQQVAAALAYAHANGVLHLDIKPTNIMFTASGAVKLCDFGMATLASAAGYGGARGGTVGYMPPEQVNGDLVDERTDVFALAVVAWQALTGESPFAAATAEESAKKMARGPRTKLAKAVPEATGTAEAAMADALAPEPANRTANVMEFANTLTFALGDAQAGAASIATLLAQATSDEDQAAATGASLPVAFRYPWLPGALTRAAAALATAVAATAPLASLLAAHHAYAAAITAAAAAAAAAWPPAGSAIAAFSLLVALAHPPVGVAAVMLPGVAALLFAVWWSATTVHNPRATTALLLPTALAAPAAGALLAGACLTPARAALTAAAAWAFAHLHATAAAASFSAHETARALRALAGSPAAWASVVGSAAAAALVSAIAHARAMPTIPGAAPTDPPAGRAIAAQVAGAAALIATQLAATAMENADNVVTPTWATAGVAVVLCIAMSIVAVLRAPSSTGQGG